jgi:DNA repair exonuclease SbcCD ATPase subunit
MATIDYEQAESDPEGYFKELANALETELKGAKEQTRAFYSVKTLLGAKATGGNFAAIVKNVMAKALNCQHGSLESAIEKLDADVENVKKKQEKLAELGSELSEINSRAMMNGSQIKSLNSAVQTAKELDEAYSNYLGICRETKPLMEKYLR